jgi:hypothetical protein
MFFIVASDLNTGVNNVRTLIELRLYRWSYEKSDLSVRVKLHEAATVPSPTSVRFAEVSF